PQSFGVHPLGCSGFFLGHAKVWTPYVFAINTALYFSHPCRNSDQQSNFAWSHRLTPAFGVHALACPFPFITPDHPIPYRSPKSDIFAKSSLQTLSPFHPNTLAHSKTANPASARHIHAGPDCDGRNSSSPKNALRFLDNAQRHRTKPADRADF